VEISVIDVDAETAKNMVNAIINFYNDKVRDLLNYKLKELIEINKTTVNGLKKEQDSLQKRIQILNTKAGLIDVKTQVKEITKGL
jgi:chaperonin cofactor prefoldin